MNIAIEERDTRTCIFNDLSVCEWMTHFGSQLFYSYLRILL